MLLHLGRETFSFQTSARASHLHVGGRGVIEGLGGQLGLDKTALEPSFSALYWYGNTSSASYWYGFGYCEGKQGMQKGDKLWQVRHLSLRLILSCSKSL